MIINRNPARPLLPLALLLCGTFLAHSAAAQTLAANSSSTTGNSDDSLVTIIVTARKQAENIQAIPESITAIDANTILDARITTLDDLNSFVTNLNITQRADNTPDVVLRGVGAFGVVQGVGFYVNDVQQFAGQTVRPLDIERIEVLKGPQGTLFGGSNVGGAIKYVTKLPTDTLTGEASIEYGEYHNQTLDGVLSGPLVPGLLLARLSAFNERSDGFLYDATLNNTLPYSNETGGRLTLEYPGDQTRILFYLNGDHIYSQNMNLYYTPPNDSLYQRIYNGGVDGTIPSYIRNLYSPTLDITHDFGGMLLTSISSYFHSSITSIGNLDKGALAPIFVNYPQDFTTNVWSEELRLSSNAAAIKWSVGAFVRHIDTYTLQNQIFGLAATIGSPVGETILGSQTIANDHTNRDYAIFGNASYDFRNWTFEGGVRVQYYDNTMTDQTSSCGPCSGTVHSTDLLPRASINYHFTQDIMGYFTVARGSEEGDLTDNPIPAVDPNNPGNPFFTINQVEPYKAEYALSYETGVKSSLFDHRLNLNLAAFYIDYTNRLFEVGKFINGNLLTFEENVGSSRNYGFELDAAMHPLPELTVSGGVGVTEAVFGPVTFLDGFGNSISADGNLAPYTPAFTATLALDWRHRLSNELMLDARVDSRFVGRSYWDSAGCAGPALTMGACPYAGYRVEQSHYQVVNPGLSLDIGNHWTVRAHVENVFDVRYNTFYAAAAETASPFNVAGINRPRQWFVGVTGRY
jgi:iron complex outermembrane receptor protein